MRKKPTPLMWSGKHQRFVPVPYYPEIWIKTANNGWTSVLQ